MRTFLKFVIVLQILLPLANPTVCTPANAQSVDEIASVNKRVGELLSQGRYRDALVAAQRAVALAQQSGSEDAGLATALFNLATIYQNQERNREAKPLYKRALDIREKLLRPDHPDVALSIVRLADVYRAQRHPEDAQLLYERWLAVLQRELGPEKAALGKAFNDLGELLHYWNHDADAAFFYQRALPVNEEAFGRNSPEVARSLQGLAWVSTFHGLHDDTERYLKRLLLLHQIALGADHIKVADTLNQLAALYAGQRRFPEADALYERALPILRKAQSPEMFVGTLYSFAGFYTGQGRHTQAEPLLKEALSIMERRAKPSDRALNNALEALAQCYRNQRRFGEAESLLRRALLNEEKAYGRDAGLARLLKSLGQIYSDQRRFPEAESFFRQAVDAAEKELGPNNASVGVYVGNLGEFYRFLGFYLGRDYYAKAEPLLKRSLAISEKWYEPDHPFVAHGNYELAKLYSLQENWSAAVNFLRRIRDTTVARERHANQELGRAPIAEQASQAVIDNFLLQAARRLYRGPMFAREVQDEMFVTAQWAQRTKAATALAQMAARQASGDLAQLVRDRQDLSNEWLALEKSLLYSSEPPEKHDPAVDQTHRARMIEIDRRLAAIDGRLANEFRHYTTYANPQPLSIGETQRLLGDGEALVLFHDAMAHDNFPGETFGWVITKSNSRWFRATLDPRAIADAVSALRCGLDYDGAWSVRRSRCPEFLKIDYTRADEEAHRALPFDLVRAHKLYMALFGQIEDMISGKHLLVVPSGPLMQLPLQVLVTEQPKSVFPTFASGYRDVAWLVRKHALTVLPAVSSLKALRTDAKEGHASEAFLGFGNPLLDGDPEHEENPSKKTAIAAAARLARSIQCESTPRPIVTASIRLGGGIRAVKRGESELADIDQIRQQMPLPGTADELCTVAQSLGVDPVKHVYLGAKATETQVKQLSSDGSLARYKIVQFATHGAVAGDISRTSEPGLILTPPEKATEVDDGYLSASEVATLNLDADWVILSACNTAAGNANGAEALSGLARAFFYAGARSLLASHWAVYSGATAKLITKAVSEMKADPKIGRAQALRRSILALIDKGEGLEAHPAFWAPFVLVGEGAARSDATSAK